MYSAMPGASFVTHIDPFMSIVMSFIIDAASGGMFGPLKSDMLMLVVNENSLHLKPSMTWDLPVGATDASNLTVPVMGGAVVVDVVAAGGWPLSSRAVF